MGVTFLKIFILSLRNRFTLLLLRFVMRRWTDSHVLKRVYSFYDPNNLRRSSMAPRRKKKIISVGKYGERVELDLNEHIDYRYFFFGYFDDLPKATVNRIGSSDEVFFIDVGANVGLISIAIASEGYRTLAIEPLRNNIKKFRVNLKLNPYVHLDIIESAVGAPEFVANSRFIEIFTPPGNAGASSSSKSWNPSYEASSINLVRIDTLDNLCLSILDSSIFTKLLIKIDVEGMELDVIAGATEILRRYRPLFLIEWKPDKEIFSKYFELENFLSSNGYKLSTRIILGDFTPNLFFNPKLNYENVLLLPMEFST